MSVLSATRIFPRSANRVVTHMCGQQICFVRVKISELVHTFEAHTSPTCGPHQGRAKPGRGTQEIDRLRGTFSQLYMQTIQILDLLKIWGGVGVVELLPVPTCYGPEGHAMLLSDTLQWRLLLCQLSTRVAHKSYLSPQNWNTN